MPKGIYKRHPNQGYQISHKTNLGRVHSDASKQKMREARLKRKKQLGYIHSPASRLKMSLTRKGRKPSKETRKKLSIALKVEKSYLWRGGITLLNKQLRNSFEYKLWREAVFKRDKYICIGCGQKGGYLEADHIKSFSKYLDLRFAVNNGRTLCLSCHQAFDDFRRRLNFVKGKYAQSIE